MKKKNIFLAIFLSLVCMVSIFGFAGCGESPVVTIGKSFQKLDEKYETYSAVFVEGNVSGFDTAHKVDFGTKINGYVSNRTENFGELDELYNVALAISNEYIDQNREYICGLNEKELSANAKKKLETLNDSLNAYTKQIDKFVKARKVFVQHFENYEALVGDKTSQTYLRDFKSAFGKLLEKNIKLSTDVAETVDATQIFKLLKDLDDPQSTDTEIVKEYIRAKMLHLFTDFDVVEFANKMNWAVQAEGDSKTRINNLKNSLDGQYETFKQQFLLMNKDFKKLGKEQFSQLIDVSDEFFLEAEAYSKALKNIDFYTFAVDYDNNMQNYLKKNKFAEVYLQKLEQFVSITLPEFIENASALIYVS